MNNHNLALNPFKKGNKGDVEGVKKVDVENDPLLQKVLEQYNSIEERKSHYKTIEYISNLEEIILSPAKINLFLQELISKDLIRGSRHSNSNISGDYVTKLIQNSYDRGHNNFILDTQDVLIDYLGHKLKGEKNNKIEIIIQGNTGNNCGDRSNNSYFTINGNTGNNCGERSTNSYFTINGNTKNSCGYNSTNSHFTIQRNTEHYCGHDSINCSFIINGDFSTLIQYRSNNSTYKTLHERTYKKMLIAIGKSNTIQLLGPNGEMLKEEKK